MARRHLPPALPAPGSAAVSSWILYDLANTIFSMNINSIYFSIWITGVLALPDSTFAMANFWSMAAIFVLSPFIGALTDQSPRRMPFLVWSTLVCVAATWLLGRWGLGATLILYGFANATYQAGLQFYDALLPAVSTPANRGRIGGWGVGIGYIGSFVGIGLGHVLLEGVDALSPTERSAQYTRLFQWTAGLFLLFAIPCFIWVRERPVAGRRFSLGAVRASVDQVFDTLRSLNRLPDLRRFLIGRVFYTDAVNTVITFMGIYVTAEVGFTTGGVTKLMALALLFAIPGGILWGRVADRIGPKRTLDIVLGIWGVTFVWIAAVGYLHLPQWTFWPVGPLAGICLGGTWAADRPYMLRLTPPDRVGEFYGLYGMMGRFSAILGPLLWAVIVDRLELGRPTAILTLLASVVIGWWILRPVSDLPRIPAKAGRGR